MLFSFVMFIEIASVELTDEFLLFGDPKAVH